LEQDKPRRPASSAQQPQRQYRLYFLDGVGSLVSRSHEFEAADDERAAKIAESWLEGRRAELWCGERKIAAWDKRD
jgi:hypothetical protein